MCSNIELSVSPVTARIHYPHQHLTPNVVESHEHKITAAQLPALQRRIDSSVLRKLPPFQKWKFFQAGMNVK